MGISVAGENVEATTFPVATSINEAFNEDVPRS
jgi:hypothetical protein